jgi:hypothetical protein
MFKSGSGQYESSIVRVLRRAVEVEVEEEELVVSVVEGEADDVEDMLEEVSDERIELDDDDEVDEAEDEDDETTWEVEGIEVVGVVVAVLCDEAIAIAPTAATTITMITTRAETSLEIANSFRKIKAIFNRESFMIFKFTRGLASRSLE